MHGKPRARRRHSVQPEPSGHEPGGPGLVYDARVKGGAHGIFADALAAVSRVGRPFPGGGTMSSVNYPIATRTKGTASRPT